MTVTYTLSVSEAKFWGFPRLLARWKGSIYRLMYREMIAFLFAYYLLAFFYRYLFTAELQRKFESIAHYCHGFTEVVPITFVLGFYVTFIVGRWWQQYCNIPWPDRLAIQISSYVQGADERGRMIRRALVRYVNQISILTFQYTSTIIKARFPTLDHLVEAGIMTSDEKEVIENTETPHGIWWVPAQWFGQLAMVARKEGRIHDDLHLKSLIDEMLSFRGCCGNIWSYDWISVPLVYTQVVTIAVYSFFVSCLFGRQYLFQYPNSTTASSSNQAAAHEIDFYIPLFTIFQFFFYVGWLKVAEAMICPFGADDEDFEINWVIDRNLQVGYLIVDRMYRQLPKLTKDAFWDNIEPEIPYTQAAASYRGVPFYGSTQAMNISERQAEWNMPEPMEAIDEESGLGGSGPKMASTSSLRFRKISRKCKDKKRQKLNDDEDAGSEITPNSSDDEIEDDERSNGSRQADEKRKKRRLGGLMLGFSRQTLASKFGSKFSISSRASFKKSSLCRSPPPGSAAKPFPYPSRSRLSTKVSRASIPTTSIEHVDEFIMDDANHNHQLPQHENGKATTPPSGSMPSLNEHLAAVNMFPPRTMDNFSASVAQIDVPPVVKEEPEPDPDLSGSDSNTTLPKKHTHSSASFISNNNFGSSQTPLIPPENCED